MRKQIRGLTQASANAEGGISAVQTAEGALTEVHDTLQKMNKLAVKVANGANSVSDRSYIQDEINQLATAYAQKDEPHKALKWMERYKDRIKTARFIYIYGLAILGVNEPLKALFQLVMASNMPDRDALGEDLLYCYRQIIQLYMMFGEPQMAEPFQEKYDACLKERERVLEHI